LDNQLDVGDVQPSGGDVGGDENLLLACFEFANVDFSGTLRDIAVENDDLVTIEVPYEFVCFDFGLRKYDGPVLGVVALDKSQNGLVPLALSHHQCVVLNCLGGAGGFVFDHVDGRTVFEVSLGEGGHPGGNRC
jgi:hypothetical protein